MLGQQQDKIEKIKGLLGFDPFSDKPNTSQDNN